MGYAHVSIAEYGHNSEEMTLHLDARYLDRVTIRIDCIGLDIGHILKEVNLYHLLNISKPEILKKEDLLSNDILEKEVTIPSTKKETNDE